MERSHSAGEVRKLRETEHDRSEGPGSRVSATLALPRVLPSAVVFRLALSPVHRVPLISSLPPFTYNHASLSSVSTYPLFSRSPSFSPRASNASLPGQGFWSKLKPGGGGKNMKESDLRQQQQPMALSRQRLLTLVYGDMETVRMVRTFT